MIMSSRLIINIKMTEGEGEELGIPLTDQEWKSMIDGVLSLGGMIYIEPPEFNGVHICRSITKNSLKYMLMKTKLMVIIL